MAMVIIRLAVRPRASRSGGDIGNTARLALRYSPSFCPRLLSSRQLTECRGKCDLQCQKMQCSSSGGRCDHQNPIQWGHFVTSCRISSWQHTYQANVSNEANFWSGSHENIQDRGCIPGSLEATATARGHLRCASRLVFSGSTSISALVSTACNNAFNSVHNSGKMAATTSPSRLSLTKGDTKQRIRKKVETWRSLTSPAVW